jgi:hypothetical protein
VAWHQCATLCARAPQTASASQAILGSTFAALACLRRAAIVAVAGSPSGGAAQPAPAGSSTALPSVGSDPVVAAIQAGLEAFDAAMAAYRTDARSAAGWLLSPLKRCLPAACQLATAMLDFWRQGEAAAAEQLQLAQAAAARSCAFLRCANLGLEGGPAAGQGEGSLKCSACRAVHYRGTACSHADWRAGGTAKSARRWQPPARRSLAEPPVSCIHFCVHLSGQCLVAFQLDVSCLHMACYSANKHTYG